MRLSRDASLFSAQRGRDLCKDQVVACHYPGTDPKTKKYQLYSRKKENKREENGGGRGTNQVTLTRLLDQGVGSRSISTRTLKDCERRRMFAISANYRMNQIRIIKMQ